MSIVYLTDAWKSICNSRASHNARYQAAATLHVAFPAAYVPPVPHEEP